jgi:penicillin amidase
MFSRTIRAAARGILTLVLVASSAEPQQKTTPAAAKGVLLVRDAWGVAHVFAKSDEGAFFGAGRAAAQDRPFQMCWGRLMFRGRVAEFFGPGPAIPGSMPPRYELVEHDRAARLYGWTRHARAVVEHMDPDLRALLAAYADGVNSVLTDPAAELHPFFAAYGIPREPWTSEDCIGLWIRSVRHFATDPTGKAAGLHEFEALVAEIGLEAAIAELTPAVVLDESAAAVQQSDVPAEVQAAMQAYAEQWGLSAASRGPYPHEAPHFSHAWAVGGTRTTSGRAVLHSDPQIPITTPATLYEWHWKGATFAGRGAGFAGSPNLLIGSTGATAWGATALGIDQADLFRLVVDPSGHPGQYQLDGVWLPWDVEQDETILVAGEAPLVTNYRACVFGPVVTELVADAHPGEEYAAKMVPLHDPAQDSFAGFVRMLRADDVDELALALAEVTWPSLNSIFAGADGRVGYWANGAAPVRSLSSPLGGRIAQDGSSLAFDWLDIVPHELMPWVIAPADGFVLSANHMPVGAWYPIPVAIGTGSTGDTSRSRRLRERLAAEPVFEPAEVLAIHHDTVQPARRDLVELGVFLRDVQGWPLANDALRALAHLDDWWAAGARMTAEHPAVAVAWFLDLHFRADEWPMLVAEFGGGDAGLQHFLKTQVAEIHALPPVPLEAAAAAYVEASLARAWRAVSLAAGPPSSWAAWFEANVLTAQLPQWTSLEGFPSLAPLVTFPVGPLTCTDGGTLLSQLGQCYSQDVEVGLADAALSLLPLGISEHDGAPYQLDQQPLWESESLHGSPSSLLATLALGRWTVELLAY